VDYGGERQITLVGMWLDWKWRECSGTGHNPLPRDWPWTAVFYILLRTSTGTTVIQDYDRLLCRQEEPSEMLKTGLKTESSVSVSSRTFLLGGPDARILLSESTWRPEFDSRSVSQSNRRIGLGLDGGLDLPLNVTACCVHTAPVYGTHGLTMGLADIHVRGSGLESRVIRLLFRVTIWAVKVGVRCGGTDIRDGDFRGSRARGQMFGRGNDRYPCPVMRSSDGRTPPRVQLCASKLAPHTHTWRPHPAPAGAGCPRPPRGHLHGCLNTDMLPDPRDVSARNWSSRYGLLPHRHLPQSFQKADELLILCYIVLPLFNKQSFMQSASWCCLFKK